MSDKHLVHRMHGMALDGGWTVGDKAPRLEGMTGSNFSVGYLVRREDATDGFMKVLDLSGVNLAQDPARELQTLTSAFNFERDVIKQCNQQRLSKVVVALAEGTVREAVASGDVQVAQYIIFEMAESSLRAKVQMARSFDVAMEFRALQNVATGLSQLHMREIAHQDVKPSNVLLFPDKTSKVADLGRSSRRGTVSPHDDLDFPGDQNYAPIELLYGYTLPDWKKRRVGSDLYQLGSLVVYMFTGLSVTHVLVERTPQDHRPTRWGGGYQQVLPYLGEYFRAAMERIGSCFPEAYRAQLKQAVSELCHPDPEIRGHPKNRLAKDPMGLQRYVSLFNLLATRAEVQMKGLL